jgi:hypothetical protein
MPSFGGICTSISCRPVSLRFGSESKIIGSKTTATTPMVSAPISLRRPRRFSSSSAADSAGRSGGAADGMGIQRGACGGSNYESSRLISGKLQRSSAN